MCAPAGCWQVSQVIDLDNMTVASQIKCRLLAMPSHGRRECTATTSNWCVHTSIFAERGKADVYLGVLGDEASGDDDGRRPVLLRPLVQLGVGQVVLHVHVVAIRRCPHLKITVLQRLLRGKSEGMAVPIRVHQMARLECLQLVGMGSAWLCPLHML